MGGNLPFSALSRFADTIGENVSETRMKENFHFKFEHIKPKPFKM